MVAKTMGSFVKVDKTTCNFTWLSHGAENNFKNSTIQARIVSKFVARFAKSRTTRKAKLTLNWWELIYGLDYAIKE